jgi:hypothetical protein
MQTRTAAPRTRNKRVKNRIFGLENIVGLVNDLIRCYVKQLLRGVSRENAVVRSVTGMGAEVLGFLFV